MREGPPRGAARAVPWSARSIRARDVCYLFRQLLLLRTRAGPARGATGLPRRGRRLLDAEHECFGTSAAARLHVWWGCTLRSLI